MGEFDIKRLTNHERHARAVKAALGLFFLCIPVFIVGFFAFGQSGLAILLALVVCCALVGRRILMCGPGEGRPERKRTAGHCPVCGEWPGFLSLVGLRFRQQSRCSVCGSLIAIPESMKPIIWALIFGSAFVAAGLTFIARGVLAFSTLAAALVAAGMLDLLFWLGWAPLKGAG